MFSQKSYLDKISKETCEYLSSTEMDTLSKKDKVLKLGVFIIGLYNKYEKKLKKEGIIFDFSKGKSGGRAFGEKVGVNMLKFCPKVLVALSQDSNTKDDVQENTTTQFVLGKLIRVQEKEFASIIMIDENGKTQKFLWLHNFKGSEKLIQGVDLEGLKIKISYKTIECYSPQLKEYISRKQVIEIIYLDEN